MRWKIALGTLLFFVLVALGSWYYFLGRSGHTDLNVTIEHPGEVKVGEPFTISVQFSNTSDKILSDVAVSLTLPANVALVGQNEKIHTTEKAVGDVGPGSVSKEEFSLIALDNPQSVQQLRAKVQYRIASNNTARFESIATTDQRIGNRLVPLSFTLPEKAVSGQPFDFTVNYKNDSDKNLSNLIFRLSYPPNFQFSKADPTPDEGQNQWDIKTLPHGEESEFTISGTISGPDQSTAIIQGQIIATLLGEEYTITTENANLSLSPSPLVLTTQVNNKADYIAHLEDSLSYSVRYRNTSNVPLQNVTISTTLTGELYDVKSISSNGSLNSITNTISWNAGNTPALALVAGNSSGDVTFTVKTKSQFPIVRLGDKNYILSVAVKATSPTVPTGSSGKETVSFGSLNTKVIGKIRLDAKAYYRDAASGVVNAGPYPPRVDQKTQYTVHWTIKNYATNVSSVKVHAFLQSGTRVTSIIKSTIDSKPVYNPASGEIVWDVGTVPATKGVISAPIEAIFQIEQTPAVNQINQSVTLLGESKLEGHDDFVDMPLTDAHVSLTTDLPDDPSITTQDRRVQP